MANTGIGPTPTVASRGFTLVELLVSLGLLSMAAALLLQCVQIAGIVARRERLSAVGLDRVIAAQRILRTVIEHMRPATRVDSALPIIDMRGTDTTVTFVATSLARAAPDALQRYRLVRTPRDELILYRANTRAMGVDRNGMDLFGWTPIPVLRDVAKLSIDYYGSTRPGGSAVWQGQWWDRTQLPKLVRVRIRFVPGDRRLWSDLIVRPRAVVGEACRSDPLTGRCKAQP